MSKIVQAINVMVSHQDKISDVMWGIDGIYFLYKAEYKWSLYYNEEEGSYSLFYYSTPVALEQLAKLDPREGESIPYVRYSSKELGTAEAYQTFEALYLLLKEKILGIDQVLKDIMKDDDDMPF